MRGSRKNSKGALPPFGVCGERPKPDRENERRNEKTAEKKEQFCKIQVHPEGRIPSMKASIHLMEGD